MTLPSRRSVTFGRGGRKPPQGLPPEELQRRPISDMWSIAEYTDHVREVMFGMRFVLDSAIDDPGIALGTAPEPEFTAAPRHIDSQLALAGLSREAFALQNRLPRAAKGFVGRYSHHW